MCVHRSVPSPPQVSHRCILRVVCIHSVLVWTGQLSCLIPGGQGRLRLRAEVSRCCRVRLCYYNTPPTLRRLWSGELQHPGMGFTLPLLSGTVWLWACVCGGGWVCVTDCYIHSCVHVYFSCHCILHYVCICAKVLHKSVLHSWRYCILYNIQQHIMLTPANTMSSFSLYHNSTASSLHHFLSPCHFQCAGLWLVGEGDNRGAYV